MHLSFKRLRILLKETCQNTCIEDLSHSSPNNIQHISNTRTIKILGFFWCYHGDIFVILIYSVYFVLINFSSYYSPCSSSELGTLVKTEKDYPNVGHRSFIAVFLLLLLLCSVKFVSLKKNLERTNPQYLHCFHWQFHYPL